jgi:hypothetical protein
LRLFCYAVVVLAPFYLLIRANAAWTPHPRFFPDDAVYARMCFPEGFVAYWHDFGFYRLLAVPAYALSNRLVMRASLSPLPYTLIAQAFATVVFVRTCVSAGLSRRRGVLLASVLLSSPLLLETLNFWSGTFNYALVLLLIAAQLRASMWARRNAKATRGYITTACGALVALLTYEIALPFILATSAFYTRRGRVRALLAVCIACAALLAFVGALVWAGVYWPLRFKLMAEQLAFAASNQPAPNFHAPTASSPATVPLTTLARVEMYASLLFSFIRTGLLRSPLFWGLAGALAGLSFLSRPAKEKATAASTTAKEQNARRLRDNDAQVTQSLVALGFAFSFAACVAYLFVTKSMNARYVAFLLIYGAATLAWTKWRAAGFALVSLLLLQAAVAASLPVHMRDVELSAKGEVISSPVGKGDVISVNGRLARASWGRRFLSNGTIDLLQQPPGGRACRYSVPCEECR